MKMQEPVRSREERPEVTQLLSPFLKAHPLGSPEVTVLALLGFILLLLLSLLLKLKCLTGKSLGIITKLTEHGYRGRAGPAQQSGSL